MSVGLYSQPFWRRVILQGLKAFSCNGMVARSVIERGKCMEMRVSGCVSGRHECLSAEQLSEKNNIETGCWGKL